MKKIFFTALAAGLVIGAAFFSQKETVEDSNHGEKIVPAPFSDDLYQKSTVTVAGSEFEILVSDTPSLREKGLSGRAGLKEGEAMLFIFDKPEQGGFWMKEMLFSIDIVWIDENFRIVTIANNVSPGTFPQTFFPSRPAKYVLEFNAGTMSALKAKEGDLVTILGGK